LVIAQSLAAAMSIFAAIAWLRSAQEELEEAKGAEDPDMTDEMKIDLALTLLATWQKQLNVQSRMSAMAARLTALSALFQVVATILSVATTRSGYINLISVVLAIVGAAIISLFVLKHQYDKEIMQS
jgi:hypothetical protein